jgi:hypothetical protein
MALGVLIGWQVLILVSVVVAALVLWRRGSAGIAASVAAIGGAALSYGFVSAAIGLAEDEWTATSTGFLIAMGIGVLGLACFCVGLLGLRRNGR